jgi:hypothetical protein
VAFYKIILQKCRCGAINETTQAVLSLDCSRRKDKSWWIHFYQLLIKILTLSIWLKINFFLFETIQKLGWDGLNSGMLQVNLIKICIRWTMKAVFNLAKYHVFPIVTSHHKALCILVFLFLTSVLLHKMKNIPLVNEELYSSSLV